MEIESAITAKQGRELIAQWLLRATLKLNFFTETQKTEAVDRVEADIEHSLDFFLVWS